MFLDSFDNSARLIGASTQIQRNTVPQCSRLLHYPACIMLAFSRVVQQSTSLWSTSVHERLSYCLGTCCMLAMQTEREQANAVHMHTTFQQELLKLRLNTAKAYYKVLTDGQVQPYFWM